MSRTRALPDDVAIARSATNSRLAASASFTEREVLALDQLFAVLRRGGDPRVLVRSAALSGIPRKLAVMRSALQRQHARRELAEAASVAAHAIADVLDGPFVRGGCYYGDCPRGGEQASSPDDVDCPACLERRAAAIVPATIHVSPPCSSGRRPSARRRA